MPRTSRRRLFESKKAYKRRMDRERARKRRRRGRRKQQDPISALLGMPRRAARRKVRGLGRAARKKVRGRLRRARRRARKSVFGLCPTCNQPNNPGHVCRQSFTERNAQQMQRRYGKRGGLPASRQNPNLWIRQQP